MTSEQREAYIKGLIQEREGYVTHGRADRVAAVDAELKRVRAEGKPASKRAQTR